jgi:hypothetical protein
MHFRCELLARDRGENETYSYIWLSFMFIKTAFKEIQIIKILAYGYQNQAESSHFISAIRTRI